MYLVVSFGVHNLKVQKAWEVKEAEMKCLEESYAKFAEDVLNPSWLAEVEKKVRATKPGQGVLGNELTGKVAAFKPNSPVETKVKEAADGKLQAPASTTGTAPVGIAVNNSSSGKVI
jgi:hypothetical protein